jgi:hypothetical protein
MGDISRMAPSSDRTNIRAGYFDTFVRSSFVIFVLRHKTTLNRVFLHVVQ